MLKNGHRVTSKAGGVWPSERCPSMSAIFAVLSCGLRQQPRHAEQVVCGSDQITGELRAHLAAVPRAPEVPDGLGPPEDLLDPLAHTLAHAVGVVPRGTTV